MTDNTCNSIADGRDKFRIAAGCSCLSALKISGSRWPIGRITAFDSTWASRSIERCSASDASFAAWTLIGRPSIEGEITAALRRSRLNFPSRNPQINPMIGEGESLIRDNPDLRNATTNKKRRPSYARGVREL